MRNLKQTKRFFLILLIGVLIYSCSEDEQVTPTTEIQQTENFVSLDEASGIATVIEYPLSSNPKDVNLRAKGNTSKFKEIEKILSVPDSEGNPSYYIVNYKDDGFIMISADNRINPIRAYSLTEKFPMESEELPSGLVGWLAESSDMISEIRVLDEEQTQSVAKAWNPCEIQKTIRRIDPDDDCGGNGGGCENQYTTIGPLLQTTWGQGTGYNNLVPHTGCSNYSNGRAPTGCVATAMAQIMKFHEFPNNYNWDNMPNGYGTNETSRLMRDIGAAVNMKYGCSGSSANTKDEVASSFRNDFGYSSASYSGFNRDIVKQQLRWNRPVILRGGRKSGWWIFATYKDGHAWVCDGYRSSTIYSEDCSMGWGYLYLHMNWGWTQYSRLNGWFAYNNWNPGNYTFNYKKGMVYNIKP
ncbi:MAG TPA: hypothetical protein DDY13_12320 [Cytophagales bacterium]|jgi:hypothetical protein|nr:hypothetical protein [Cytophagales bacterium]